MNKDFWTKLVRTWCKVVASIDTHALEEAAVKHARKDLGSKSNYSLNPLDDDDEDDEGNWDV